MPRTPSPSAASARRLGFTPGWLRGRAATYRAEAARYSTPEIRERTLALAYHYERVADELESTPKEN